MLKAPPYPFKYDNACYCHQPCTERLPMGEFVWLKGLGGTDPWASFRGPSVLLPFAAVGTCEWRSLWIEYREPYTREYRARVYFDPSPDGTGIPCGFHCGLSVRTRLGTTIWDSSAVCERTLEDQFQCNWLPDLTIDDFSLVYAVGDPTLPPVRLFLGSVSLCYGFRYKSPFPT